MSEEMTSQQAAREAGIKVIKTPTTCRKCSMKRKCGFKYREHNRTPRCKECLIKWEDD